ncbi:MAG: hypothetical protein GX629_09695, partial [Phycisphaerae bacterium]|nr:hypothetical protein [Phycisphaerae bacterium]
MNIMTGQYFLNHRLDPQEIQWQVRELAAKGYQGIYPHARQGLLTPYFSNDWWRSIDAILDGCRNTGMTMWIWDEDYFPSGLAGGRVVWDDPGLIARGLEFTSSHFEGNGPFELDFSTGMLLKAFAVSWNPDGTFGEFWDITDFCGTRRQTWTPRNIQHGAYSPPMRRVGHPHWRCTMTDNRFAVVWTPPRSGRYTLVGITIKNTSGVHPDMLNPQSVQRFIEFSYEPYYQRYGKEFGTLIQGAFTDEPSPGGFLYPWTRHFPQEFQADHGYDLLEQLPHLALDLNDQSPMVRHHYRLTQHRLQEHNYIGQLARWCADHRIAFYGHLTRTEWLSLCSFYWPNELRCYKQMTIPSADPLTASCGWKDAAAYHTGLKVASSAAHLFDKGQAGSDALAVVGDEVSLRDLKYQLDYQMVLGINHFVLHGLSYSIDGPRKDEVPPSIFYQHTEWKYMNTLMDHVRTTAQALTGGEHICDLAVLYPSTSLACQANASTDMWGALPDEMLIHDLADQLLSHQKDFDLIDEVTLQEKVDLSGKLLTAEPYRTIILPYLRYIDIQTAQALQRFAHNGGCVILIGPKPRAITGNLNEPLKDWVDDSMVVSSSL